MSFSKYGSDTFKVQTGVKAGQYFLRVFSPQIPPIIIDAEDTAHAIIKAKELQGSNCYLLFKVYEVDKNGVPTNFEQVSDFVD